MMVNLGAAVMAEGRWEAVVRVEVCEVRS